MNRYKQAQISIADFFKDFPMKEWALKNGTRERIIKLIREMTEEDPINKGDVYLSEKNLLTLNDSRLMQLLSFLLVSTSNMDLIHDDPIACVARYLRLADINQELAVEVVDEFIKHHNRLSPSPDLH